MIWIWYECDLNIWYGIWNGFWKLKIIICRFQEHLLLLAHTVAQMILARQARRAVSHCMIVFYGFPLSKLCGVIQISRIHVVWVVFGVEIWRVNHEDSRKLNCKPNPFNYPNWPCGGWCSLLNHIPKGICLSPERLFEGPNKLTEDHHWWYQSLTSRYFKRKPIHELYDPCWCLVGNGRMIYN